MSFHPHYYQAHSRNPSYSHNNPTYPAYPPSYRPNPFYNSSQDSRRERDELIEEQLREQRRRDQERRMREERQPLRNQLPPPIPNRRAIHPPPQRPKSSPSPRHSPSVLSRPPFFPLSRPLLIPQGRASSRIPQRDPRVGRIPPDRSFQPRNPPPFVPRQKPLQAPLRPQLRIFPGRPQPHILAHSSPLVVNSHQLYPFPGSYVSFTGRERDYGEIARRYPKLYINGDFVNLQASWACIPSGEYDLMNYVGIEADFDPEFSTLSKPPPPPDIPGKIGSAIDLRNNGIIETEDKTRYSARVMITTGIEKESTSHLFYTLKFLVLKEGNNFFAPGGEYIPEIDGQNEEDEGIKRAAIRYTKEQTGLDLEKIKNWWKFLEIHYERSNGKEVTVIFVVSQWDLLPEREVYLESWKARQHAKLVKEREMQLQRKLEKYHLDKKKKPIEESQKKKVETKQKEEVNGKKSEEDKESPKKSESFDPSPSSPSSNLAATDSDPSDEELLQKWASELLPIRVDENQAPKTSIYVNSNFKMESTINTVHPMVVPMSFLLKYDSRPYSQASFELSLFAESLKEKFQQEYGNQIYFAIRNYAQRQFTLNSKKNNPEKVNVEFEKSEEKVENETKHGNEETESFYSERLEGEERFEGEEKLEHYEGEEHIEEVADEGGEGDPHLEELIQEIPETVHYKRDDGREDGLECHVDPDNEKTDAGTELVVYDKEEFVLAVGEPETHEEKEESDLKSDEKAEEIPNDKKRKREEEDITDHASKKIKSEEPTTPKITQPSIPQRPVDPVTERAFYFFDIFRSGYLRESELIRMLHCLNLQLSKNHVEAIIRFIWGNQPPAGKLLYRKIIELEEDVSK